MNKNIRFAAMIVCPTAFLPVASPSVELPGMSTITSLMMEFDANGDGAIDRTEFRAGVAEGFKIMDKDEDGKIVEAEIAELRDPISDRAGDIAATAAMLVIKPVVLSLDKHGDKVVTREEYVKGSDEVFDKLDANHDGKVTKAEINDLPLRLLGKAH